MPDTYQTRIQLTLDGRPWANFPEFDLFNSVDGYERADRAMETAQRSGNRAEAWLLWGDRAVLLRRVHV